MWKPTGRSHCWGARERDPLSGRLPDVLCPLWDKSVYPRGQEQQSLGAHGTGANPLQSVRGNCRRWAGTLVKSSSPRPETKRLPKPKPMLDQSGPANPALRPASGLTGHRDTARRRSRQAGSPANSPGLGTACKPAHSTTTTATANASPTQHTHVLGVLRACSQ